MRKAWEFQKSGRKKRFFSQEEAEWKRLENEFFSGEVFQWLGMEEAKRLKEDVASIPIVRETERLTTVHIIEMRKLHPRFMEPWSDKELELLCRAIQKTNQLKLLCECFGRNENSIRAAVGGLLVKKDPVGEKRLIPVFIEEMIDAHKESNRGEFHHRERIWLRFYWKFVM